MLSFDNKLAPVPRFNSAAGCMTGPELTRAEESAVSIALGFLSLPTTRIAAQTSLFGLSTVGRIRNGLTTN